MGRPKLPFITVLRAFRISDKQDAKLEKAATKKKTTKSVLVRELIDTL